MTNIRDSSRVARAGRATGCVGIARRPLPTTHSVAYDTNEKTKITRERHPFEGQSLGIVERRRHNGEPHLLLKLPDGSRLRVPARWTTAMGADAPAAMSGPKPIAPVELLFRAHLLVDSLLRRATTSSAAVPNQHEGTHGEAACTVRAQSAQDGVGRSVTAQRSFRCSPAAYVLVFMRPGVAPRPASAASPLGS